MILNSIILIISVVILLLHSGKVKYENKPYNLLFQYIQLIFVFFICTTLLRLDIVYGYLFILFAIYKSSIRVIPVFLLYKILKDNEDFKLFIKNYAVKIVFLDSGEHCFSYDINKDHTVIFRKKSDTIKKPLLSSSILNYTIDCPNQTIASVYHSLNVFLDKKYIDNFFVLISDNKSKMTFFDSNELNCFDFSKPMEEDELIVLNMLRI